MISYFEVLLQITNCKFAFKTNYVINFRDFINKLWSDELSGVKTFLSAKNCLCLTVGLGRNDHGREIDKELIAIPHL